MIIKYDGPERVSINKHRRTGEIRKFAVLLMVSTVLVDVSSYANVRNVPEIPTIGNSVTGHIPWIKQKTISGTVTDGKSPVAGVSVIVKGTSVGTRTNESGKFSLNVPNSGTVLVFSMVGYVPQEVNVEGKSQLDVTLVPSLQQLEEAVVVGFGTQKKVNLTGAVGTVSSKELESRPVTSATQALQGLVPGLTITTNTGELDKNMSINVRGTGTIGQGSSGAPLILIDGMEGDINTVNPQDIENVSILKDAAASSIYGARAPFGVILVTTKSGKKGRISVNYNNSFRFANPLNLPRSMDSYSFGLMLNQANINSGASPFFNNETLQKMLDFQSGKLTAGIDPSPTNPNAWSDEYAQGYANSDVYSETYKSTVASQEHNLSLSGGNEKTTYYLSANALDQGGLLRISEDGLKRYNITAKVGSQLTDWLSFNFSSRFTNNNTWVPSGGMRYQNYGNQNWPNIPMYDPNGYVFQPTSRELAYGGRSDTKSDRNYYQAAFVIEPIKNWITNVQFNYSSLYQNEKSIGLPVYQRLPDGSLATGTQDSRLYQDELKEKYLNANIYSEYSRTFNDLHNFKIMGGFQSEETRQSFFSVQKYGLIMTDLPEFDLTNGLGGNGSPKDPVIGGNRNEWATVGFFSRFNYDFDGRYLFEANMRYDGSSRFRSDSRWVLSPSFSAGWNVARESFWTPIADVVNTFKPRLSYGQLSNQNTESWYPTYRNMVLGSLSGDWLSTDGRRPNIASIGSLVSSSLTWETVRSWNIGLDYGLLNNRLSGSFDYYKRFTKNMVGPAPELPATLGISPPAVNNTDLYTRGWELSLAWKDQTRFGLNYGVNVSLSDQTTYIDSYPGNITKSIGSNGSSSYISGQKVGLIWGFETVGIAKSQEEMDAHLLSLPNGGQNTLGAQWSAGDIMYRDVNGDGKISAGSRTLDDHGDLVILGDASPHYFFGVDLTANWKGVDFRAFFQGVLNHDFWPGGSASRNNGGAGGYFWGVPGDRSMWQIRGFQQHGDYFRAEPIGLEGNEIPANLDAYFPRPLVSATGSANGKNQLVQSRYMQNARYIRLKNLQVGYTLPSAWLGKVGISKCRIFLSGENIFTVTPLFSLFDPETAFGGIGGNAYPLSRTISMGLNITL